MVAFDTRWVEGIRLVIITIMNQIIDFRPIIVVFGVIGVSSLSSPMLVCYHDSIANHHSFKINFSIVGLNLNGIDKSTGKIWDIHAAVRLASDPEIISNQLWESIEPGFNGSHIIRRRSALIVNIGCVLID